MKASETRLQPIIEGTKQYVVPQKFEQITQRFPRLIGRDKKRFRAVRELKNGAYIEVNLSAKNIEAFCSQALESVELTADDWKVETN
jgi:topoisomerase IA-like protein